MLWLIGFAAAMWEKKWILDHAHNLVSIAMFSCVFVVSILNAISYKLSVTGARRINRYFLITAAMALAVVLVLVGSWTIKNWRHEVITIEASLIVLFGVFWATQTYELRANGIRPKQAASG